MLLMTLPLVACITQSRACSAKSRTASRGMSTLPVRVGEVDKCRYILLYEAHCGDLLCKRIRSLYLSVVLGRSSALYACVCKSYARTKMCRRRCPGGNNLSSGVLRADFHSPFISSKTAYLPVRPDV
ncbi:hypothetical protein F4806DRAFT_457627 [Annulohypoxylon nitens]|nr:hypothetical protein F4806DRAFT_457627 [Annulohypoxylon nitens]